MAKLTPEFISPAFVEHIWRARRNPTSKRRAQLTKQRTPKGTLIAKDWCVDQFHTETGEINGSKNTDYGNIVAGGGVRRFFANDIKIYNPYEFLQNAVHNSNGLLTEATFNSHQHCGEIFVSEGAVTPEEQTAVRIAAWAIWQASYKLLSVLSPADAKRVTINQAIGHRGSAPTIWKKGSDRYEIANPDYLKYVSPKYPLNPEFVERLVKKP